MSDKQNNPEEFARILAAELGKLNIQSNKTTICEYSKVLGVNLSQQLRIVFVDN
jgi:hypothetical protein